MATRRQRPLTDVEAIEQVIAELRRAREKHPQRRGSGYEGAALVRAKADRLFELVDGIDVDGKPPRKLAIQVAAMAIRFITECT